MELKQLMSMRIDYLEKNGFINAGILNEYRPIADKQKIIHNLFVKYNLTHQDSIIDKAVQYQEEIIQMENIILPRLLSELNNYLQHQHAKKYQ